MRTCSKIRRKEFQLKVVFWSPVHGQCRTTSNLIAAAICTTLMDGGNNAVLETHFQWGQLEGGLLGKKERVAGEFFQDIGIDVLTRTIRSESLNKDTIMNSSISLLNGRLNFISGTNKLNKEHYYEKLTPALSGIIKGIEEFHDIVFIDTNAGFYDPLTKKLLEYADLIVINLCQNAAILEHIFTQDIFKGKEIFYIIGGYDIHSRYSITNIRRKYRQIQKDQIGAIHYNTSYMDALSGGEAFSILEQWEDNKQPFLASVKNTSEKLLKRIKANEVEGSGEFVRVT